jgi:hypothetical protein
LEDFHQINPDNIVFVDDNILEKPHDVRSHRNCTILVFVYYHYKLYIHVKIEYLLVQSLLDLPE